MMKEIKMTTFMADMNIWLTLNRPYSPEKIGNKNYRSILKELASTFKTPAKSDLSHNQLYDLSHFPT